jgi:hypothetical protein
MQPILQVQSPSSFYRCRVSRRTLASISSCFSLYSAVLLIAILGVIASIAGNKWVAPSRRRMMRHPLEDSAR